MADQLADKSAQIRVRVTQLAKEELEEFAAKAGYKNPSDYYRAVLLQAHTVVLGDAGAVHLLVGPECPEGAGDIIRPALEEAFKLLNRDASDRSSELGGDPGPPAPVPVSGQPQAAQAPQGEGESAGADSPPPGNPPPPPPADPVPAAPPVDESAGPAVDPLGGGGGAGATATPPQVPPASDLAAGAIPGPGGAFPLEFEPGQPAPSAGGPPQRGETEDVFFARRVPELQAQGRGATVARAEARAEWRIAVGTAPPLEAPVPAAAPVEQPQPTVAPTGYQCPRCSAVRQDPNQPCPDCGLRPGSYGGGVLGPEG